MRNKPIYNLYKSEITQVEKSNQRLSFLIISLILLIGFFILFNISTSFINTNEKEEVRQIVVSKILPQYGQQIEDQVDMYISPYQLNNISYQKNIGSFNCDVHSKTGDGDNTPRLYYWVICVSKIDIYREKQFDKSFILNESQNIKIGPFLVSPKDKLYSTTNSDGTPWEDFYNLDKGISWKPY